MLYRRPALAFPAPLLLVLFLLLSLVARAVPAQIGPSTGSIVGTVRDRSNHALPNATVRIANGPQEGAAQTDSRGRYALTGLTQGVYSVLAQAAGYTPAQVDSVAVLSGLPSSLNLRLAAVSATTGTLQAKVQDRTRAGLSEATVDLLQAGRVVHEGTTDAAGLFAATELAPGAYFVQVQRPGFTSVSVARAARVRAGAVTAVTVTLKRDPTQVGSLVGTVVDQNGADVTTATLRLTAGTATSTTTSAAAGHYQIDRVPAGTGYSLAVSAPGFTPQTLTDLTVQNQQATVADVTLIAGAPSTGSIAGTILDSRRAAVPGATVRVTAGPALGQEAQTDNRGRFALTDLPPFRAYAVVAEASGFASEGASGIAVQAGQTTALTLLLRTLVTAPGALDGQVTEFGSGIPLAGVTVDLLSGPSAGAATVTDAVGRYALQGLGPASDTTVRFRKQGFQSLVVAGVPVQAGRTHTLEVALTPVQTDTAAIAGQVRSASGTPLAGVTMTLFAGASSPQTATTGSRGGYVFLNLRPDTDYAVRAEKAGYVSVELSGIAVQNGQRVIRNFTLRRGTLLGTLRGQVLDLLQHPIAGARVRILDGPALPDDARTDARGEFVFAPVPRGDYIVEVQADGFRSQQRSNVSVTPQRTTSLLFVLQQ